VKSFPRSVVPVAALLLLALLGPGASLAEAPEPVAVHLKVDADRSVANLDERELTHALIVALTSAKKCPIHLVEQPVKASIRIELKLKRWLDRRTPDGVPQFDRRTGREMPGHQYEIWGVYDFAIHVAGEQEPVEEERNERFRSRARESRNPMFDARARALEEAHERIVDDIVPEVCRQARRGVDESASAR
jgi:hypothetical protein